MRKFWEEYTVIEFYKMDKGRRLTVILGADEPLLLEKNEAREIAKKVAKNNGFVDGNGMGEITVHGQNAMATREFYYKR